MNSEEIQDLIGTLYHFKIMSRMSIALQKGSRPEIYKGSSQHILVFNFQIFNHYYLMKHWKLGSLGLLT